MIFHKSGCNKRQNMGIKCCRLCDFGMNLFRRCLDIPFKKLLYLSLILGNEHGLTIGIKSRATGPSRHLVVFADGNRLHPLSGSEPMVIPDDHSPGRKVESSSKGWC